MNNKIIDDFNDIFPNATNKQKVWMAEYGTDMKQKGLQATAREIVELVAHSSYDIDPGGRVSDRNDSAEDVCHEIIKSITSKYSL